MLSTRDVDEYYGDMENTKKTLVTRAQAANMFGITVRTVDRWATAGIIKKYENQVGHVRVAVEEIERATGVYNPSEILG